MQHNDLLKEKVAKKAFNYLLESVTKRTDNSENEIWLGIGSGTTIKFFLSILGEQFLKKSLPFTFVTVSSSMDSESTCRELKFPIKQFGDLPSGKKFDYYIDGADEVDSSKRCLKGLGGASTREKLLRLESDCFIVLVDETKKVSTLCTKNPIVVEILPFACERTVTQLKKLVPTPSKIEMRKGTGKMGYVITDNNNYLVDIFYSEPFKAELDLRKLEQDIKLISGVVETGLFSQPATIVFIASDTQVEVLH